MKKLVVIFLIASGISFAQYSGVSKYPGAFSRMGFGARGAAMGNSMLAVIDGNISGYYNPAISSFQKDISFLAGYTFLSLDRSLNFLSFGKNFELGKKRDDEGNWMKPKSIAGLSVGVINSGVSGIEERDNQGIKFGDLSTSENLFFVSVSNQFSDKMSIGLTIRFYYFKLYKDLTSTGVGLDFGVLYRLTDDLTIAALVSDINSKYKWNTNPLYGQQGSVTSNEFAIRKKIGVAYNLRNYNILLTGEFEMLDSQNNFVRAGVEYYLVKQFGVRAGLDNYNVSNSEYLPKPSFGFTYNYKIKDYVLGLGYAYVVESYSPSDYHILSLNFKF